MTPLDLFILELHRATERHQCPPVAVAMSALQPVAIGLPKSIYGLAVCYDTALTVDQGFIFFDSVDAFARYVSKAA